MSEMMELDTYLQELTPTLFACMKCRWCIVSCDDIRTVCPMNERFKYRAYSAGGVLDMTRSLYDGHLKLGEEVAGVVYACTMCKSCAEACGGFWYITNEFFDVPRLIKRLREELVIEGITPPLLRDYFKSVHLYGNPYKQSETERANWCNGIQIEMFKDHEYLLYIGDVGSFDDRGQKIAKALVEVLNQAGVSFGILGNEETCDGNEVDAIGEFGLFQLMAEKNMELFKSKGITKVITLSPHGYNIMKNRYPDFGYTFEVLHYTQFLAQLMNQGKLTVGSFGAKVTFHDPCYLGRYNDEYAAPRVILASLEGSELIEMEQNRNKAFCCGGGGGNFFSDVLGGSENSPNRIRVRQALETGAEVLAVACPQCARMLDDAVMAEKAEEHLKVKDLTELLAEAV